MSESNKNGSPREPGTNGESEADLGPDLDNIKNVGPDDSLPKELEKARNELLYMKAEFDNSRKRMVKDQEQSIKFANERIIRDLSPVVDLLERGLGHGKKLAEKPGAKSEGDFATLVSGVDLTLRELTQTLGRFGVEFFGKAGEPFDPARHEAISIREDGNTDEPVVVDVLQRGSLLHGRLLSPAKVVVAQKKKDNETT